MCGLVAIRFAWRSSAVCDMAAPAEPFDATACASSPACHRSQLCKRGHDRAADWHCRSIKGAPQAHASAAAAAAAHMYEQAWPCECELMMWCACTVLQDKALARSVQRLFASPDMRVNTTTGASSADCSEQPLLFTPFNCNCEPLVPACRCDWRGDLRLSEECAGHRGGDCGGAGAGTKRNGCPGGAGARAPLCRMVAGS